ncbi:autophagy protein 16-like [Holotrichia oblita]|uniref:Autophagy protein 16-like n=1 Tax=Holotrichia oblita TaxID=644536 RepID=A0ACB9SY62_HOLOL|nr:autophagy protein 16-like [Holotrichia oblita]
MATAEEFGWRDNIIAQLQDRNKSQLPFQDLIIQNNKLFDAANALRNENLQLRVGALSSGSGSSSTTDVRLTERIQQLEQKVLAQQEELTELHRRKGENAQQIIDLNIKLQDKDRQLSVKETSLLELMTINNSLRAEIKMYEASNKQLENLNQMLKDEHQALHLAFTALEEKLKKAQVENNQLIEKIIKYKAKDADRMNEENDNFLKKRSARMQKELEEACRDTRGVSPEDQLSGPAFRSPLPNNASIKFDAHEGEVNAVKWSPVDRLLATGGADRKVKLWDISKGTSESRGILVGSNAGVMSVDFDSTGTLIIGASNDYASRVWTIADLRIRVSTCKMFFNDNIGKIYRKSHIHT